MSSSADPWGYSTLGNSSHNRDDDDNDHNQSFPLQNQIRFQDDDNSSSNDYHHHHDGQKESNNTIDNDFRINFKDNNDIDPLDSDDDDDDEDHDLDDYAPLAASAAGTKRPYSAPSSKSNPPRSPKRILAGVFGSAVVVAMAFALLSLLNLNNNKSLDPPPPPVTSPTTEAHPEWLIHPPPGQTLDEFTLANFKLPPWDWDINTFLPINITNGPKFTSIQWRNGEQYLAVDCASPYQYHFQSMAKNEFQTHPSISHSVEDLLHLGEEPYVFVMCPPGQNNANVVFREFDMPDDPEIPHAVHTTGTNATPAPIVEDVVMLLVDAISRAKFLVAMKEAMAILNTVNTTGNHRIFDFQHYNVLGQNSPPNKAFIYSGQSIENMNKGPKHWVWDVFQEQGFKTAHTDGECGGEEGIHDYVSGAITSEYSHIYGRIPAEYQMNQDHHPISFDIHLAKLLKSLLLGDELTAPLLNPNSVLVIMADHGLHYGRETYTFPGFIHHKIPPFFVAIPKPLLAQRPDFTEALEQNQDRILSHLDLHQTFIHLAYGDQPVPKKEDGDQTTTYSDFMKAFIADGTFRRQVHGGNLPNMTSFAQTYGRSIFLPIEENRSCASGGIPHDFCAFQPFLDLDPAKPVDAKFLRQVLLLFAKRMNELTVAHRVDDICSQSSLVLDPPLNTTVSLGRLAGEGDGEGEAANFDDIGTLDLVMESAYASASPPTIQGVENKGRVFYMMVRDRHRPRRKYSITMKEKDLVFERTESITIQQMSAYEHDWLPCARAITAGGKAIGDWQGVVKHFCTCSATPPPPPPPTPPL
ncbi:hypothetical protein BG004_004955 [Podila humilis]|nr:hypothetical protein BG004_004955 [Podila humilis]